MNNTGQIRGIKNFDYITVGQVNEKLRPICKDAMILGSRLRTNKKNIVPANKKHKLYFAGPWFDESMLAFYEGCERIASYLTPISKYSIFWPRKQKHTSPEEVFANNIKQVRRCDTIIACINRKDVGTAFELGMAKALNKKIFLLGYDETDMLSHTNVMLAFCGKFLTIDHFAKFLIGTITNNNIVPVDNTWEGKE